MSNISLNNVSKIYPGGVKAVDDLNLEIKDKEFLVLVGPSGCGKTTTLRMVAGLEDITDGELLIDDAQMNDVPAKSRDLAMVFQNYALYPHMTVYDNMSFGLKIKRMPKPQIKEQVGKAAALLGIEELLARRPKEISGGEMQRVALGRAIVRSPKAFLMDEPLSNLDAKLRAHMRAELIKLHRSLQITFIYVTHDQAEAMTMGTRNKDIAWEFLKTLLSPDIQSRMQKIDGFPVDRALMQDMIEHEVSSTGFIASNGEREVEVNPLTQEQCDAFMANFDKLNTALFAPGQKMDDIMSVLEEELPSFFSGQKSAEDVAVLIQNRIDIILNE